MRLKKIEMQFMDYGEHKGKYLGKITFEDNSTDQFTFGLSPEMCARYLNPIAQEVINSDKELFDYFINNIYKPE